jgi:hypothetical protein
MNLENDYLRARANLTPAAAAALGTIPITTSLAFCKLNAILMQYESSSNQDLTAVISIAFACFWRAGRI